jgi:hypothetical protein
MANRLLLQRLSSFITGRFAINAFNQPTYTHLLTFLFLGAASCSGRIHFETCSRFRLGQLRSFCFSLVSAENYALVRSVILILMTLSPWFRYQELCGRLDG